MVYCMLMCTRHEVRGGGGGDRVKILVGLFHFISVFVLSFF